MVFTYDQVIHKLENAPEEEENEYMEATYEGLRSMEEFAKFEAEQTLEIGEAEVKSSVYGEMLDQLRSAHSLDQFTKYLKTMTRSEEMESYHRSEIDAKSDLVEEVADEFEEDFLIDTAIDTLNDIDEVDMNIDIYREAIEAGIGPKIKDL